MYSGRVPLLTKGPLVMFYGRSQLVEEVSPDPPGQSLAFLFLSSLAFQVLLFLFKWNFSRKIQNYALDLKATLVNNVLNIYSLLIIIIITLIAFLYAIYHYLSIKNLNKQTEAEAETETTVMPAGLLLLNLLTFVVVLLPFIQNFALRSVIECSHLMKHFC